MGLIKAISGSIGGVLADQWKEFFYCESMDNEVLMTKGKKRTSKRSSNKKGEENIISNGSGIAVADGQCMIIVEQGKVVELCAEPGEFTYNSSTEPSIFTGKFGESLKQTFKQIGKRFTYGGDTGKDQRIYYFNTKDILDNKFGTPTPIIFEVMNKRLGMSKTVNVRCNGTYTYRITNPLLFYSTLAGNVASEYRREQLDAQLKADFIDALQPAFAELTELELRPAQIPAHTKELKTAINHAMQEDWTDRRGITVESIALGPITLTPEDMKKIAEMEDAATMGSNPFMMAGRMTNATADAMNAAAANPGGAMNGFIGMNMAGGAMGGGFNAAQSFYNMGIQQQQQMQQMQHQQSAENTWKCACGNTASGKFCPECGAKKPEPKNTWKCSCGAMATGKFCPECGAKKPEDNAWTCACGAKVTGKFCPECGSPKPANDSWTCACGMVNKGKFCSSCGAKKPSEAPVYRCNQCGWQPEDPKNPPKFCPQCGDRFDENDR
ncbi:MAG: SPFH domain-containing protein [Ruminococcaceae bacterium]|nr:SPFH domain-containing protein [Oscillospiraceae bacterium]